MLYFAQYHHLLTGWTYLLFWVTWGVSFCDDRSTSTVISCFILRSLIWVQAERPISFTSSAPLHPCIPLPCRLSYRRACMFVWCSTRFTLDTSISRISVNKFVRLVVGSVHPCAFSVQIDERGTVQYTSLFETTARSEALLPSRPTRERRGAETIHLCMAFEYSPNTQARGEWRL